MSSLPAEAESEATTGSESVVLEGNGFSRGLIVLLSCGLIFHLAAIICSPATIPPSSQLQRDSFVVFGPYVEALYLNHGWHYFAPDPGPSTIVRYSGFTPEGAEVSGRMPDKQQMQPRLLYHRHFMLTEALPRMESADPALRTRYEEALADGVGQMTGATVVELEKLTHRLPTMEYIRAGFAVDDADLFDVEPLGRFVCP